MHFLRAIDEEDFFWELDFFLDRKRKESVAQIVAHSCYDIRFCLTRKIDESLSRYSASCCSAKVQVCVNVKCMMDRVPAEVGRVGKDIHADCLVCFDGLQYEFSRDFKHCHEGFEFLFGS